MQREGDRQADRLIRDHAIVRSNRSQPMAVFSPMIPAWSGIGMYGMYVLCGR